MMVKISTQRKPPNGECSKLSVPPSACAILQDKAKPSPVHTSQTPQEWTLYVDDSPYGLSDEQLSRLGERFYRVDDMNMNFATCFCVTNTITN
jgi:hypothetical protein